MQMTDSFIFRSKRAEAIAISRRFEFSPFRDFGIETISWITSNHRGFRCDYVIDSELRIQNLYMVTMDDAYPTINGIQADPDPVWLEFFNTSLKPRYPTKQYSGLPMRYMNLNYTIDYTGLAVIGIVPDKANNGHDGYSQVIELRFENGVLMDSTDRSELWKSRMELRIIT